MKTESENLRAHQAAEIALRRAHEECFAAKINPAPYIDTLTDFVSREVREAIKEMGRDQKTADTTTPSSLIDSRLRSFRTPTLETLAGGRHTPYSAN